MSIMFEPVELKPKTIKVTGTIMKAIKTYNDLKIPLSRLVSDYYIVKDHRNLEKKDNPWIYYHKGILSKEYEVGASVIEDAFNEGAVQLVAKKKQHFKMSKLSFYIMRKR